MKGFKMKQFILTLVLLVSFLVNAYAGATELERGDLDAAAQQAAVEQAAAAKAMNLYKDIAESQNETLVADLEQ